VSEADHLSVLKGRDSKGLPTAWAVGAVIDGVNKLQYEKSNVPSSAEEGRMRDQKRNCEATKIRAAGVVLVQFHHIF